MRLSRWLAAPPTRDAVNAKVTAVVADVLGVFGLDTDPEAWLVWGDDPAIRWTVLAPSDAGLVTVNARVNVPGEGPRASGKLTRWSRVQTGELAVETQGGHRLVTFQVEGHVLRGADGDADAIGDFAQVLFAAIDGRPTPAARPARKTAAKATAAKATAPKATGTRTGTKAAAATSTSKPAARAASSSRAGSTSTRPKR